MKWTEEIIEKCLSMVKQGLSYKVIADELGIKMGTVRTKLNRVGIKNSDFKQFKKYEKKKCLNCGDEIVGKKFCNSSCVATYYNKKRGNRTEIEKNNIKIGIIKSLGYVSLEDWMQNKNKINKRTNKNKVLKNGIYVCKKCNKEICDRPEICKHYFNKNNIFEKYFGFDSGKIGTDDFYKEFDRIIENLKKDYYIDQMTIMEISSKYGIKNHTNIKSLFKRLKIKIRKNSESFSIGIMKGKINFNNSHPKNYKYGKHITWDNREILYRSSYELDYYKKLDEQKIYYLVEKLRLNYYDTQKKRKRIAIPDIYIPNENKIIEIKSEWTYDEQNWKDRLKTYKELGYKVKLIMGNSKNGLNVFVKEIDY